MGQRDVSDDIIAHARRSHAATAFAVADAWRTRDLWRALARFHARHRNVRHVWACGDASFPSARVIEEYASPRVDESDARFSWAEPDLDGLRAFLAEARNARAESAARKKPRPLISPRAPADARSDSAGTKTRPTRP